MAKRSERLLELMQALRRRRYPVSGRDLADETGVSLRTLYRDIDTLKGLGAAIEGEAGIGFQLAEGYWLPPLMFSEEELEAVALGLRGLIHGPDADMAARARDAQAKIAAVLPEDRRDAMEAVGLFAILRRGAEPDGRLAVIRAALREEKELGLHYRDRRGAETERVVWPVALGYFESRQLLVAWCTLRTDYRRFWVDAIRALTPRDRSYPTPRRTLLHDWRTRENLADLS